MDKVKENLIWLFIPYLTFCALLYHVAFWDTFHLNGLTYISPAEIIKSVVQPISYTLLLSIIVLFFNNYILGYKYIFPVEGGRETSLGKFVNKPNSQRAILILWFLLDILILVKVEWNKWFLWSIFSALPFYIWAYNNGFLQPIKDSTIRYILIQIIISLPFICFGLGKENSEVIKYNIKYQYTTKESNLFNKTIPDTLKLIGTFTGNIVFTDLKNSTLYIFKEPDSLVLKSKE